MAAGSRRQQHRDQQDRRPRQHEDHQITEAYTIVQLKRQDELTRRIQCRRAKAARKAKDKKVSEISVRQMAA
jgi:hypothetical protein